MPTEQSEPTTQERLTAAVQVLNHIGRGIRTVWGKRPKLSYTLYVIVFVAVTATSVLFLQWSVYNPIEYAEDAQVDNTTRIMGTMAGQLTRFVSQMWLEDKWQFLLNFLVVGLMYLVVITFLNRFWVATAIFGTVMVVFSVANRFKYLLRNEPIIPADLSFISSGNTGEIVSFIPEDGADLVNTAIVGLTYFVVICLALQLLDRRNGLIPCHWRPSRFLRVTNIIAVLARIAAFVVTAALLVSFTWNLNVPNSWAQQWARELGDSPQPWNAMGDAQSNGTAINFLRLAHAKTMEQPEDYSEETMQAVAKRYAAAADDINATRTANLTDSTVVMILSESFSDPTRIPNVTFSVDPMPNIRAIKDATTSGLMLSPGYGGGTANIEYQALTGLNMANFDESMLSVYQQLVPTQEEPYSFNRIWSEQYGESGSVAFHPYYKNMYLRDHNYDRFGFSELLTLDSDPAIEHQDHIDASPYVSDAASYANVLDAINSQDHPQFIQLVTMQNHSGYGDYYATNEFREADLSPLDDDERWQIENYAKGLSLTDQATAEFLNSLNTIDKPVTVIFYGDHLPSIYTTANADPDNTLTLHETDYFIWSNQASASTNGKVSGEHTAFSSSNYCMSLAAEHMNATVSPYLALLTELQREIPSISRVGSAAVGWGEGDATYLDENGNIIDPDTLTEPAKQLLHDYQLVQYDMTAGDGYLYQTEFFDVEESEHVPLMRDQVPQAYVSPQTYDPYVDV
ncbi:LTA synthase family protein [Bifidobacterium pullorum subsp. saeculare]|nr:LTA synthase family protein [Bifidobacterium pullorum subsp. saeculare]